MTYHVRLSGDPILNGITKRPASWATLAEAERYVADCVAFHVWGRRSEEDFTIEPHQTGAEGVS